MAQASWDRLGEITSGKAIAQPGLAATGNDYRDDIRVGGGSLAHEPVSAMTKE
jgi:hypothetical protein